MAIDRSAPVRGSRLGVDREGIATDLVVLGFRFILASLFFVAGLSKLGRRQEFARVVRRYEILPERFSTLVAVSLPPLEIACGALLLVGLLVTPVALLLTATLCTFCVAIAVNLFRGREIDCGCFGAGAPRRIGWSAVARNVVLAVAALAVALDPPLALSLDAVVMDETADVSSSDAVGVLVAATSAVVAVGLGSEGVRIWRTTRSLTSGRVSA